MKNIIGRTVKIYDGELLGWTTGEIVRDFGGNRVKIKTKEGYDFCRWLETFDESVQDGYCAYLIK